MSKGLALETVVKWIIYIVVAGVVINLVFFFYDDVKRYIETSVFKREKDVQTEKIEQDSFSAVEVRIFVRACWDKTGERYEKDVICYILKGDVSGVDGSDLVGAVDSPAQVDVTEFDNSATSTIIRFEDISNKIIVES